MTDADTQPGTKRGQLAKIVLIPILGFVLYRQVLAPGEEEKPKPAAPARRAATATPTGQPEAPPAKPPTPILPDVRSVGRIAAENPFARPAALLPKPESPPIPDQSAEESAEVEVEAAETEPVPDPWEGVRTRWETKRVSVVLRAGNGLIAVLGDETVRVGDVLDGVRVVEIRPDGVLLEEVPELVPQPPVLP